MANKVVANTKSKLCYRNPHCLSNYCSNSNVIHDKSMKNIPMIFGIKKKIFSEVIVIIQFIQWLICVTGNINYL